MPRTRITSQRVFIVVLLMTAVAALLPGRMLRWTNFPAELLDIVLTPFTLAGNALGQWLRPTPGSRASAAQDEVVRHLQSELAEFERLYLAEQARAAALEEQLEQLQKIPPEFQRSPVPPLIARIAARSPGTSLGTVSVNRGARHGVRPGTVAVHNGVHLIGRVTSVTPMRATLLPSANPSSSLVVGSVLPKGWDPDDVSFPEAPRIQLEPVGDGTLVAQTEHTVEIHPGDEVRVNDPTWPEPAQAMIIGYVASAERNHDNPLWQTVVVEPAFRVSQLAYVILKLEPAGDDQAHSEFLQGDDAT